MAICEIDAPSVLKSTAPLEYQARVGEQRIKSLSSNQGQEPPTRNLAVKRDSKATAFHSDGETVAVELQTRARRTVIGTDRGPGPSLGCLPPHRR
eukprot:383562-Hanusia_phi.AAC.1